MNSFIIIQILVIAILFLVLFNIRREKLTFYMEKGPSMETFAEISNQLLNKTESNEIKKQKLKYCKSSKEGINERLKDLFTKMGITYTDNPKKCDFYIPYWYSDDELSKFINKNHRPNMILNVIPGVDYLNRKNKLWEILVKKLGRKTAGEIMPPSYSIFNNEFKIFEKEFNKNDSYVLKTEEENAQGIYVHNDMEKIQNQVIDVKKELKYPVTIIQKFIKPLLIKDRVFKIRLFLFIKCKGNQKSIYIHKQGGIFYGKDKFDINNLTYGSIVANAYWFNKVPIKEVQDFLSKHPRNLVQVKEYFKKQNINSSSLFVKINALLKKTFLTLEDEICSDSKVKNNIKLGLFGVDILIDEKLKPWLIEMNVSPSSTAFDKLGESQKKKVWVDSMKIALLKNPSNHEFEKIN
jgi:hypothetical protein